MSSDSWAGFAKSPKPDLKLVRTLFQSSISSTTSIVDAFRLTTSAEGLTLWLMPTLQANVFTSGKILFSGDDDTAPAIYSSVDLGKKAIINSEKYGEIQIKFSNLDTYALVELTFSKMLIPNQQLSYLDCARAASVKLSEALGGKISF